MTLKKAAVKITAVIMIFIMLSLTLASCIKYSETEPMSISSTKSFIKKHDTELSEDYLKWSGIEYSSKLQTDVNSSIDISFVQNFADDIAHLSMTRTTNGEIVMSLDCYLQGDYIYYTMFESGESTLEMTRIKKNFAIEVVAMLDTSTDKAILESLFKSDAKTLEALDVSIYAVKDEDKNGIFNVTYSENYLTSKNESSNDLLLHLFNNAAETDFSKVDFGDCTAKYTFNKVGQLQNAEVSITALIDNLPYVSNFTISNYTDTISFDSSAYTPML